jgi:hypothetical protein
LALLIGILGLLTGVGVILRSPLFVILLLFIVYFVGLAVASAGYRPCYRRSDPRSIAAQQAMKRAGYAGHTGARRIDDIGLLVYYGDEREPKLYRTSDVPTDATHIRPFVVLICPYSESISNEHVVVCFNMFDNDGNRCFIAKAGHPIKLGDNFITPNTWLPLGEQEENGIWSIEVSIGNILLGVHEFGWLPVGGEVRAEFNGDGEIDERSRRGIELRVPEPVTLDELLEEQAEVQSQ